MPKRTSTDQRKRLPTLATIAAAATTQWTSVQVAQWYGAGERTIEGASDTAV
jgi:hypothetical protein